MSSRKRPFDPRVRGQSPPDKRSRPPERSGSMQNRYANPGSPTFPSPPVSRKNSFGGGLPPNVPTGPAPKTRAGLRIDQYRPGYDRETADRSFITNEQVMSPASAGSGASTPVHNAPPAPNMLPVSGANSHESVLQLPTMAALRALQLRRQAIGVSLSASSTTPIVMELQKQLEAHQAEIRELKKDREEMKARINSLEGFSTRVDGIADEIDRVKQQPDMARLQAKVAAMEKLDLPSMFPQLKELGILSTRMDETKRAVIQYGATVKNLQDQVQSINSSTEQTVSRVEADTASFNRQMEAQNLPMTKDDMEKAVISAVDMAVKVSQTDLTTWRKIVEERLKDVIKSMQTALAGNKSFIDFKASQERINQDTTGKLLEIHGNDGRTYAKVEKLDKRTESSLDQLEATFKEKLKDVWYEFDKYIGDARLEAQDSGHTLVKRVKMLENNEDDLAKDYEDLKSAQGDIKSSLEESRSSQADLKSSLNEVKLSHGKLSLAVEMLSDSSNQPPTQLNLPEKNTTSSPGPQHKEVGVPAAPITLNPPMTDEALNKIDTRLNQSNADVEVLRNRILTIEQTAPKYNDLVVRVNNHDKDVSRLDLADKETSKSLNHVAAHVDSQFQQIRSEMTNINENIDQLDNGLQAAEQKIHTQGNSVNGIREEVPSLFTEKFEPLKQQVEQLSGTIKNVPDELALDMKILKAQMAKVNTMSIPSADAMEVQRLQLLSTIQEAQRMKTHVEKLETSIAQEVSGRERRIQGLLDQIATKFGLSEVNRHLDALRVALHSLESRYENITTDQLYQGIVHWFGQNYPSQQQFLGQLGDLQREFAQLQQLVQPVQRMVPQLQGLVQSAAELQQLPQIQANANEALNSATESLQRVEALQNDVGTLRTDLYGLRNDSTSFVRAEALTALDTTVAELETAIAENKQSTKELIDHVSETLDHERQARVDQINEIRSTAAIEHGLRVGVEKRVKENHSVLSKQVEKNQNTLVTEVGIVKTTLTKLRQDFDTVNEHDIQPSKEFFPLQGMTAVSVAQLQQTVENVNQNTGNRNPIPIAWVHDFNRMQDPMGKGKGRKDT